MCWMDVEVHECCDYSHQQDVDEWVLLLERQLNSGVSKHQASSDLQGNDDVREGHRQEIALGHHDHARQPCLRELLGAIKCLFIYG